MLVEEEKEWTKQEAENIPARRKSAQAGCRNFTQSCMHPTLLEVSRGGTLTMIDVLIKDLLSSMLSA